MIANIFHLLKPIDMKKEETQKVLERQGWTFSTCKTGYIAIHKTGIREYAPTLTGLFKKIRGY